MYSTFILEAFFRMELQLARPFVRLPRTLRRRSAVMVNNFLATNWRRSRSHARSSLGVAAIADLGIYTEMHFNQVVALKGQCGMGAGESSGVA